MATITINTIQTKRSFTSGALPTSLLEGEEFVNLADGFRLMGDGVTAPAQLPRIPFVPAENLPLSQAATSALQKKIDTDGDASGATAVPSPTAPAGTLARALGDLSGLKAPGPAGFARLDGLYFTAATRALFNSPAVGEPTNWLGNGAGGSASQYAYGGFGQGVFLSGIGDVGVVGATRTEDVATSGRLPIGLMGWAFNFKTGAPQTAWAGYFEARRKKGAGQIHGLEVNVTELGDGSDRIIPTAKGSGPQAAYASWASGVNIAPGGNVVPGQQTGWDGNQNVTQAANAGVALTIYSNGAKVEKGIIVAEGALVGCDGSGGANLGTAFETCRGAQIVWIDGTTRQAARITSDISPTGPATRLTFTDAGLFLDQAFLNKGAFSLANGFLTVGTVAPTTSLSSFMTMTVPGNLGQYIDNVCTVQNQSFQMIGDKYQRGNAAVRFTDHLGQERAATGYSRLDQNGANVGFKPNLFYNEIGNQTADLEDTDFGVVNTHVAGAQRFPGTQYILLGAEAATGMVRTRQHNGLYVHELDTEGRAMTLYGGDPVTQSNGKHLKLAGGYAGGPAATISAYSGAGPDLLALSGSGIVVQAPLSVNAPSGFNGVQPVGRQTVSGPLATDGTASSAQTATAFNSLRAAIINTGLIQ